MTETSEAVISEAVSVIDQALSKMLSRELVSSIEVTDVLLDVRSLLTVPVVHEAILSPSVSVSGLPAPTPAGAAAE